MKQTLNHQFLDKEGAVDIDASAVKGFLDEEEGRCLYRVALEASKKGNCLEIGSYCGKSAVYLGAACRENGAKLYSIDHHRGSAEQQPGEVYFDAELHDEQRGCVDTLPHFLATLERFSLKETVVPLVGNSVDVARNWREALSLVFIDGGHALSDTYNDYNSWTSHILPGGLLIIHDIFASPAEGGQSPRWIFEAALASRLFVLSERVKTLGVLQRVPVGAVPPFVLESFAAFGG